MYISVFPIAIYVSRSSGIILVENVLNMPLGLCLLLAMLCEMRMLLKTHTYQYRKHPFPAPSHSKAISIRQFSYVHVLYTFGHLT